jgi:hypothetical protein
VIARTLSPASTYIAVDRIYSFAGKRAPTETCTA